MLNKLFCHPLPRISICSFERFIVSNMNPFVAPILIVGVLIKIFPPSLIVFTTSNDYTKACQRGGIEQISKL